MRRLFLAQSVAAVALLISCATPKIYTPPPKANLLDPLPGEGLIYLLRAPYDEYDLEYEINANKSGNLPAYTYTAFPIQPGTYTLTTVIKRAPPNLPSYQIPPLTFTIRPDERLCFFLPAPERRNEKSLAFVAAGPGRILPLFIPGSQETGASRAWTLATTDDVNWFVHYTKLFLN